MDDNISVRSITPTLTASMNRRRRSPSASSSFTGTSTSTSNNANAVVDLMRDAVTVLRTRQQTGNNDPNSAFAAFIASELRTLPEDDAAHVRGSLNRHFMECMDEIRKRKQYLYVTIGPDGQITTPAEQVNENVNQ